MCFKIFLVFVCSFLKKNIYLFYDGIKTKFCIGTLVKGIHETNAYCVTLNLDFFFESFFHSLALFYFLSTFKIEFCEVYSLCFEKKSGKQP